MGLHLKRKPKVIIKKQESPPEYVAIPREEWDSLTMKINSIRSVLSPRQKLRLIKQAMRAKRKAR